MTAVTLTSSWDCSTARSAVQNSPDVPKPALFTRIRTPGGEPVGDLGAVGGVGQVGGQHLDVRARLVVQFGGEPLQPFDVTGDQHQVVAVDGVAAGETRPQPGRRSGDQSDGAWHADRLLTADSAATAGRCAVAAAGGAVGASRLGARLGVAADVGAAGGWSARPAGSSARPAG